MKNTLLGIKKTAGFTIVELLVVIVVIGILAAITIVSYSGISQRATVASIQSELDNAAKQLKLYYTLYEAYPSSLGVNNCPAAPRVDNDYCLKFNSNSSISYSSVAPSTFHLTATNGVTSYSISNNGGPTIATVSSSCPTGFIPVPGSGTYGTNDFCVMKYEAKIQGNDVGAQTYNSAFVPESRVTGTPWVNISQANAISEAQTACTGCRLITEAEWMTLAQNVLSVSSNWDNGAGVHTVGTGYIYSGHNDSNPGNSLAAAVDGSPYTGTGQSSPSSQKRTLTLTNGEVIWDMTGNVWEWTNAAIASGQQPGLTGEVSFAQKQWNNTSLIMNGLPTASQPNSTGIVGISNWSSTQGIGKLNSYYAISDTRFFLRGGHYFDGSAAGVLALSLGATSASADPDIGFRVAK